MRPKSFLAISILVFLVLASVPLVLPAELEIVDHKTEEEGLPDNAVAALCPEGESGVFVASAAGLHIFLDYFFLPVFQRLNATCLSRDPDGDVWAATDTGLIYRLSLSDDIWTAVRYPFLPKERVTAIAARHNALFIGTDKGLSYFSGDDETFHRIMKRCSVRALAVLSDGTLLAAVRKRSPAKAGLVIIGGEFAGRTGWVEGLSGTAITCLVADADILLIGTETGSVLVLDDATIRPIPLPEKSGRIGALLVREGFLLVGSDKGLYGGKIDGPVALLSTSGGATITGVTSLAPGAGARIWVGTKKDGLYLVRIGP